MVFKAVAKFLIALCLPILTQAGVVYNFSVPSPGNSIDPISFSFESPTYVTADGPFAITQFSITGLGQTFTLTHASAGTGGCLDFATAGIITLPESDCPWYSPPTDGALVDFVFVLGLPAADGRTTPAHLPCFELGEAPSLLMPSVRL